MEVPKVWIKPIHNSTWVVLWKRVPVNCLAQVWVLSVWFVSLWVWERDIGVWLLLQLNTQTSDTVKDEVRQNINTGVQRWNTSHLIATHCVEDTNFRMSWWNITIWISSGWNLQDLWVLITTRPVWSYHEPFFCFWPCYSFRLWHFRVCVWVAAGMLGLCKCINDCLHCCRKKQNQKQKKLSDSDVFS